MLRSLASIALVFAIAPALRAQDKPTPAVQSSIAGTWQFDQSQSDTIGPNVLVGLKVRGQGFGGRAAGGGDAGGGAVTGGGRNRRGGGGSGGSQFQPDSATAAAQAAAGQGSVQLPRDPHLALVIADMNPGARMIIAINDSLATLATVANATGQLSSWKTDGRKRQDARMDGTIIETQSQWKGDVLQLIRGIPGVGSLKREFKGSKDGKILELKETLEVNGQKIDKKLMFTRQ